MTHIDIILFIAFLFFIIYIINCSNNIEYPMNCNNDTPEFIYYSGFKNKPNKKKIVNKKKSKSTFENKGKDIVNDIYDLPMNTFEDEKKQQYSIKNHIGKLPINESRENNRYNRKRDKLPTENELLQINNYNLKKQIENNNDDIINKYVDELYSNNMNFLNDETIDNKLFNKSKHNQKLFKDSKTINARFNKNSLINNYKSELDYYEGLNTPWWSENIN